MNRAYFIGNTQLYMYINIKNARNHSNTIFLQNDITIISGIARLTGHNPLTNFIVVYNKSDYKSDLQIFSNVNTLFVKLYDDCRNLSYVKKIKKCYN